MTRQVSDATSIPGIYDLVCCRCGHRFACTCARDQVFDRPCPSCEAADSRIDRGDLTAGIPGGRQFVGRDWRGMEAASMSLPEIVDPRHQAKWRADVPSIQFNQRGQVIFSNDAHQRRVYGEMAAARKRYEEAP